MNTTSSPLEKLKNQWSSYQLDFKDSCKEFSDFHDWINRLGGIAELQLDQYTNILQKGGDDQGYFTNWLERKTEKCGKFRTASSYAYGVFRRKIHGGEEYMSAEQRGSSKEKEPLSKEKASEFFTHNIKPALIALENFEDKDEVKPLEINYARKISYMFNPGMMIPIYKNEVIKSIADFLHVDTTGIEKNYKATQKILERLNELGWPGLDMTLMELKSIDDRNTAFEQTQKLSNFLWGKFGKSFPLVSKNIIFHGAPGTGKTYSVLEGIKQRILLDGDHESEVLEFAQFHPSYTYEDFIEGLKPVAKEGGGIDLELQSGRFKLLCKKAMKNLVDTKDDPKNCKNFYFIADEINRAELSRVLGEVLVCLEESKRLRFENGKLDGLKLKTQYCHMYKSEEDAVFTDDEGAHYFGVPENVYFIGTMNDIDRSVDSFDFALRRRFVWERTGCDYTVLVEELGSLDQFEQYKTGCEALNEMIVGEFGGSYEVGHAYFLEIGKKINKSAAENLFNSKIRPLLREYWRSEYPRETDVDKKLKEAKHEFMRPFGDFNN